MSIDDKVKQAGKKWRQTPCDRYDLCILKTMLKEHVEGITTSTTWQAYLDMNQQEREQHNLHRCYKCTGYKHDCIDGNYISTKKLRMKYKP